MKRAKKKSLLIFVIAYHAETTLKRVLERIPASLFNDYNCEILVVDDASDDRTFLIGREYRDAHPEIPMTVLRNTYNQGYGGNQKVGYSYALAEGFDFVAMLHGDGQYAPEELPRLVKPLRDGEADAVFGSRMMTWFGALKGGMPLYKWVGNRILSTLQNTLLRTQLSEFHSGYRVYSTQALRRIQFKLNSNDFHFDTEIIIQLLNAKQRIQELEIPTYYGDEICRVNGMKYAGDVAMATIKNVFHRSGVLWQRRYEPLVDDSHSNSHYELKLGYSSSHQWALDAVPQGSTVLDLGGGPLGVARELAKKRCDVAVVDQHDAPTSVPEVKVFKRDLNQPLKLEVGRFSHILMLDIIEHLLEPEGFIERLRSQFDYRSKTLILTTPNVAFLVQRLALLVGQFNYGKLGILDITHTRLFTFGSIQRLLEDAGFRIKEVRGVPAPFPKVFGENWLGLGLLQLNEAAIRASKTLFSYQIFVVAESTPTVEFVLEEARLKANATFAQAHVSPASEPLASLH